MISYNEEKSLERKSFEWSIIDWTECEQKKPISDIFYSFRISERKELFLKYNFPSFRFYKQCLLNIILIWNSNMGFPLQNSICWILTKKKTRRCFNLSLRCSSTFTDRFKSFYLNRFGYIFSLWFVDWFGGTNKWLIQSPVKWSFILSIILVLYKVLYKVVAHTHR